MTPGLIVTDLDGTLLDRTGRVSPRNRAALKAAHDAGWHVAIATGRTWRESHRATDCIAEDALFIGVGGAILHEAGSGRVLSTMTIDAPTALALARTIVEHGHRAHILLVESRAGHDYFFVGTAELDPATRWWLSEHPVTARDWHAAPDDAHDHLQERVLRVGTIGPEAEITPVLRAVEAAWGQRLAVRAWGALTADEVLGSRTHMLEIFSPDACKWRMACVAADRLGIPRTSIVAFGDGLNDVELIGNAPLGVAMANADPRVAALARAHTAAHHADGVAVGIEALLEGRLQPGWRAPGAPVRAGEPA